MLLLHRLNVVFHIRALRNSIGVKELGHIVRSCIDTVVYVKVALSCLVPCVG